MPERKGDENQQVYDTYKLGPWFEKAIKEDTRSYREARIVKQQTQSRIAREVWGDNVDIPTYVSPSTASNCLRWVGYELLSAEKGFVPKDLTPEVETVMLMGSGAHWLMQKKLGVLGGKSEQSVVDDEGHISGRLDMLLRHPLTGEYMIVDFKFVSSYAFNQIKRANLPSYMRNTKDIYAPKPEHKIQLLLYMWAQRQKGTNIESGHLMYYNRDNGKLKEAVVMWDPETEYEIEEFIQKIKKAVENIDNGELPDPSVQAEFVCAKMCPYLAYCDYGQHYAKGEIKNASKTRKPSWVYKQAKQRREQKRQQMENLGIVQPRLIDEDGNPNFKNPNESE
jgi:hypothetical protein